MTKWILLLLSAAVVSAASPDAKTEKGKDGKPLAGRSYLVVTVPVYVFNGRRYVRDFDRWVDDGPARPVQQ